MIRGKRYNLFWPILFVLMLVALYAKRSDAQYREIEQETKVITGDVNIAGDSSRAIGLSNSLGDVDINDCVISKQKGNVLWSWQNYDYNLFCLAEYMDRAGKPDEAAAIRCQIPQIKNIWSNPDACINAMYIVSESIETPELAALYNRAAQYDEDEEEREEQIFAQQQEIAYVREEIASIKQPNDATEPLIVQFL